MIIKIKEVVKDQILDKKNHIILPDIKIEVNLEAKKDLIVKNIKIKERLITQNITLKDNILLKKD